jgi:3-oxoacyl-[acyl-carrier protein] reductase
MKRMTPASAATLDRPWAKKAISGVRLTRHYIGGMLARGTGRVVFISSEAALTPAPELPHYSAMKTMDCPSPGTSPS